MSPLSEARTASLGEMINAKMPVPPGFAVTAYAYEKFILETRIAKMIYEIIKETVTNSNDPTQYAVASERIRELIEKTKMLKAIENAVKSAYEKLNKKNWHEECFCCCEVERHSRRPA